MNQILSNRRLQIEEPVWCDHCRVRIAPYEEMRTVSARAFHKDCFRKADITERAETNLDEPGLDLAVV